MLEPLILGLAGARRINRAYRETAALPDHMAFFEKCIQVLKIDLQVTARDRRRLPAEGPLVVVNHPFGGLDGIVPGAMMAAVCWVSRGRLIPSFRQGPPFDKQRGIVTPFSEHQGRQTCRCLT